MVVSGSPDDDDSCDRPCAPPASASSSRSSNARSRDWTLPADVPFCATHAPLVTGKPPSPGILGALHERVATHGERSGSLIPDRRTYYPYNRRSALEMPTASGFQRSSDYHGGRSGT